jgi:hypothetical protein
MWCGACAKHFGILGYDTLSVLCLKAKFLKESYSLLCTLKHRNRICCIRQEYHMKDHPISATAYEAIISGRKSTEVDEVITITFEADLTYTIYFRITWSHLHERYIADHVQNDGLPLIVDEMTRAHVLAFFEDNFKISKVAGMMTEEQFEDQTERLVFLQPIVVRQQKPAQ